VAAGTLRRYTAVVKRTPWLTWLRVRCRGLVGNGRWFGVLAVVPFEEEDESPFVGLLKLEAA
jgi:hypothetical protein